MQVNILEARNRLSRLIKSASSCTEIENALAAGDVSAEGDFGGADGTRAVGPFPTSSQ